MKPHAGHPCAENPPAAKVQCLCGFAGLLCKMIKISGAMTRVGKIGLNLNKIGSVVV